MAVRRGTISNAVSIGELKECKLFQDASDKFLTRFATEASTECFQEGAIIVNEGGIADKIYCLTKGEVAVIVGPEEKIVANLSAVTTFGEMAKIQKHNEGYPVRTATVKASSFCVCRILDYRTFESLLNDYPNERQMFRKMAGERAAASQNAKQKPKGSALMRNVAFAAIAGQRMSAGILKRRTQKQHRDRIAEHFKEMEGMELSIEDFLHLTRRDAELRHRIEKFMDISLLGFEHSQSEDLQKWCEEASTVKSGTLSFVDFIEGIIKIRDKRPCEIAEPHSMELTTLTEDIVEKSEERTLNGYHAVAADSKLMPKKSPRASTLDRPPSVSSQDASLTSPKAAAWRLSQIGAQSLPSSPQSRMPSKDVWSRQSSHGYAWSRQVSHEYAWSRQSSHETDVALSPRSRLTSRDGSPLSRPCSRSCAETAVNELRKSSNARPVIPPAIRRR